MSSKFVVLLSGGLDSVVNLHLAAGAGQVVMALTFTYGQRAAQREIASASYFCKKLSIPHQVIDLPFLGKLTHTALVNKGSELPHLRNLDDMGEATASAKAVWVPNRNGVFLNIAASFAESMGADFVVPGFNKEEAATFPDNSQAYIDASNGAFSLSTLSQVKVKCFTTDLDKTAMVKTALRLNIEIDKLWSCYESGETPCGQCESCQRTRRALEVAGEAVGKRGGDSSGGPSGGRAGL